jgi:hypothetical protein
LRLAKHAEAMVGIFCGCDRDILHANGRTRYTRLNTSSRRVISR